MASEISSRAWYWLLRRPGSSGRSICPFTPSSIYTDQQPVQDGFLSIDPRHPTAPRLLCHAGGSGSGSHCIVEQTGQNSTGPVHPTLARMSAVTPQISTLPVADRVSVLC